MLGQYKHGQCLEKLPSKTTLYQKTFMQPKGAEKKKISQATVREHCVVRSARLPKQLKHAYWSPAEINHISFFFLLPLPLGCVKVCFTGQPREYFLEQTDVSYRSNIKNVCVCVCVFFWGRNCNTTINAHCRDEKHACAPTISVSKNSAGTACSCWYTFPWASA